ncbi:MAG: leucine-rich repeat protein [Clostridiales bacterium]|nr:leucine-rich repeat protein [Clostridiales bacterium]
MMMKATRTVIAILTAVLILTGLTAYAQTDTSIEDISINEESTEGPTESENVTVLDSGKTGQVTWVYDSSATLTISGEGYMTDYKSSGAPWYQYSESIVSVVFEDGVTKVGAFSFYNCKALSSVTFSDSVKQIGKSAFENCTSLEKIILTENVNTIFESAFSGCTALSSIFIPVRTKSICALAFRNCSALAEVFYGGSESDWEEIDFHGSNNDKETMQEIIHYDSEPEIESETESETQLDTE